jgi:hypothetical protein
MGILTLMNQLAWCFNEDSSSKLRNSPTRFRIGTLVLMNELAGVLRDVYFLIPSSRHRSTETQHASDSTHVGRPERKLGNKNPGLFKTGPAA